MPQAQAVRTVDGMETSSTDQGHIQDGLSVLTVDSCKTFETNLNPTSVLTRQKDLRKGQPCLEIRHLLCPSSSSNGT